MTLTDSDGAPLTAADIALLGAHPHLARVAVKGCKIFQEAHLAEADKRLTLLCWARILLPDNCLPHSRLAR